MPGGNVHYHLATRLEFVELQNSPGLTWCHQQKNIWCQFGEEYSVSLGLWYFCSFQFPSSALEKRRLFGIVLLKFIDLLKYKTRCLHSYLKDPLVEGLCEYSSTAKLKERVVQFVYEKIGQPPLCTSPLRPLQFARENPEVPTSCQ